MKDSDIIKKRIFDVLLASILLLLFFWLIILLILISSLDTKSSGIFMQKRIGQHGKPFLIYKIRTMKDFKGFNSNLPLKNDSRISPLGKLLRKTKLDELPQLINIFLGNMSLVGPRPDLPGYADELTGEDRIILSVKPGLTGPASIKFRNEQALLAQQENPEYYNKHVIWPQKVEINKDYIKTYSFCNDIKYLYMSLF